MMVVSTKLGKICVAASSKVSFYNFQFI